MLERLVSTSAPASTLLVRFIVGPVFLSEGIQKFLYPDENGIGRFAKIGIPSPELTAPFVGVLEIICGTLIIIGLLTRLAAIPLIINMLVAILSTKMPILLGYGFWGFSLRNVSYYGFWGMAHEIRTDWSMLLGSVFLLIAGAGTLSIDAVLAHARATGETNGGG